MGLFAFIAFLGYASPAPCQTFTDDPLTPGIVVKAVHVVELRTAIANLRSSVGLPVFTFTDPVLTPTSTPIRALHITELRTALGDVFNMFDASRPSYTDATLTGVVIKAAHIQELRTAVVGMTTFFNGCASIPGGLTNGVTYCGRISSASEVDEWTFTAAAGDHIAIHIGEITDDNDFWPWIRLQSPTDSNVANAAGPEAAAIDVAAPVTATYKVLVASADAGFDGTGFYRLTVTHSPGPVGVGPVDEGGALTNGAMHTGRISRGDLDTWSFTANAGERISVHVGQTSETDEFRPWIRLWSPTGIDIASGSGDDAQALYGLTAPATGTYLVLVASFDSGLDGEGTYRLTMVHTGAPVTVSPGDEGGPLTNGGMHTGEIVQGDLDVWTFTATAGDRIGVHIGQIAETDLFRPWIRLWSPAGAELGSEAGDDAAAIFFGNIIAPTTGTYMVLVASFDFPTFDGEGTYRLTMAHTPGPITVSAGDQGGPMSNGAMYTGEIVQGDLDVWTFTANAGERITVHVGKISETDTFPPWIRLWSPDGAQIGYEYGPDADRIDNAVAPVTGTYLILVSSADDGYDGEGTYRLTMARTGPEPITVSPGDQGGPLTNGGMHTGEILQGDVDAWTFTANAGDRISVHIGQITEIDDFHPWIRLWSPTGTSLDSRPGPDAAVIDDIVAPTTGTYLVLVATNDVEFDGEGTYRLTMTHSPGPVVASPGDQGGPLSTGVPVPGDIVVGDLDVFSLDVAAGAQISVTVTETTDLNDFRPWIRLWSPTGGFLAHSEGLTGASISNVTAPSTGTYLVLVASFDPGLDGTGSYQITATVVPPP